MTVLDDVFYTNDSDKFIDRVDIPIFADDSIPTLFFIFLQELNRIGMLDLVNGHESELLLEKILGVLRE